MPWRSSCRDQDSWLCSLAWPTARYPWKHETNPLCLSLRRVSGGDRRAIYDKRHWHGLLLVCFLDPRPIVSLVTVLYRFVPPNPPASSFPRCDRRPAPIDRSSDGVIVCNRPLASSSFSAYPFTPLDKVGDSDLLISSSPHLPNFPSTLHCLLLSPSSIL